MTVRRPSRSGSSRPKTNRDIHLPDAFRELFLPSRYKAFYGGRGSGKSHAMATALVLLAVQKPLRILSAAAVPTLDSGFLEAADRRPHRGASGATAAASSRPRPTSSGHERLAPSSSPGSPPTRIRSNPWRGSTSPGSRKPRPSRKRSLDILVPTIRKDRLGTVVLLEPEAQPSDPVDALFRAGPPPPDSDRAARLLCRQPVVSGGARR